MYNYHLDFNKNGYVNKIMYSNIDTLIIKEMFKYFWNCHDYRRVMHKSKLVVSFGFKNKIFKL